MFSRFLRVQLRTTGRHSHIARVFYNTNRTSKLSKKLAVLGQDYSTTISEGNPGKESSNSSSKEPQTPEERAREKRKARLISVMIGSAVAFFGSSFVLYSKLNNHKAKAEAAPDLGNGGVHVGAIEDGKSDQTDGTKKNRNSFKARRVIEYENRIRQYSTPDKVFRYFASLKVVHPGPAENEVFMTPEDFVRSLTPGKIQPEGCGLDEFKKFDPEKHKYKGYESDEFVDGSSVFKKMGDHGLISFSDYIFLLTVLSMPPRLYEIAFQMFDLNGDGEVSPEEFEKVQNTLFSLTATGSRHRDHSNTGSILAYNVNTGLKLYFFGKNGEKKLTGQKFIEFQSTLQKEVMYLEFLAYDPVDGKITEKQFAHMLLMYSSSHEKKKGVILKRVKKAFKENAQGICFKQYLNFFHFLRNISEAEVALSFHTAAKKAIDPETFKHVARTIAGVTLDNHVVDIVYTMFDENDDGELSHKEFISVMKNQLVRGLENPKDTGFTRLLTAMLKCAKHQAYEVIHPNPRELADSG